MTHITNSEQTHLTETWKKHSATNCIIQEGKQNIIHIHIHKNDMVTPSWFEIVKAKGMAHTET